MMETVQKICSLSRGDWGCCLDDQRAWHVGVGPSGIEYREEGFIFSSTAMASHPGNIFLLGGVLAQVARRMTFRIVKLSTYGAVHKLGPTQLEYLKMLGNNTCSLNCFLKG